MRLLLGFATAIIAVAEIYASLLALRLLRADPRQFSYAVIAIAFFLAMLATADDVTNSEGDAAHAFEFLLSAGLMVLATTNLHRLLREDVERTNRTERRAASRPATVRRFEAIFRQSPNAMLLCSPDGLIVDSNLSVQSMLGASREQLRGKVVDRLVKALDDTGDRTRQNLVFRTQRELTGRREYRMQVAPDRHFWLDVDSAPFQSGGRDLVLVSARDVTSRKTAEQRFDRERSRWALLVEALPLFAWTTDWQLRITSTAGSALETLGLTDVEGLTLSEIYGRLGLEVPRRPLHLRALAGRTVPLRWQVGERTFEGALVGVPADEAETSEVIGIALDVTGRERAQEDRNEKERSLVEILDHAPFAIFIKDLEGRHLWVNRRWERIGGLSRAEIIGRTDFDLYRGEQARLLASNDELVRQSGEAMNFVEKVGRRLYASTKFLMRDDRGEVYGICGIACDETDRLELERQLHHRRDLLDDAQAIAGLASWEWDLSSGQLQWANSVHKLYGTNPSDERLLQDVLGNLIHEEDRPAVLAGVQAALQEGRPYDIEYRVRRADGALRWIHDHGRVEVDERGTAARFFGFVQNITETREATTRIHRWHDELEVLVQQRTAELSEAVTELESFSYAVSHDLRQPLRIVGGYLEPMQSQAHALDEVPRQNLAQAVAAVRRLDGMIADLVSLSRVTHARLRVEEVDLAALARNEALQLMRRHPERNVQWSISPGLRLEADPELLRILIAHLLDNALKFTRGRSPARIEVGRDPVTAEYFVRDNGTGFDAANAGTPFEPFRRHHPAGQFEGNGIGLATAAKIAARHGGHVLADSRAGEGTTIRFRLAAERPEAPARS